MPTRKKPTAKPIAKKKQTGDDNNKTIFPALIVLAVVAILYAWQGFYVSPYGGSEVVESSNVHSALYTNQEFGFTLALTDTWQDYYIEQETVTDPQNWHTALTFIVPTTDALYPDGYPVLTLLVYEKASYDVALNAASDDGIPLQNFPILGTSSLHVVLQGSGPNAPPPSDVMISPSEAEEVAHTLQFADIVQEFVGSSYRVLRVVDNPHAEYSLVVATERQPATCGFDGTTRCGNDTSCGSVYTSPTCYFFIEPQYVDAGGAPRLVKQLDWEHDRLHALNLSSIRFIDADTVEFSTNDGDAGAWVEALWRLNISTGVAEEISKTEGGI